jgi:hypothetical protein
LLTVASPGRSLASNGQQFDSSRKRGRPFEFTVGAGQVIQGWDLGLLDMCPGEKRKSPERAGGRCGRSRKRVWLTGWPLLLAGTLTIPAELGYGSRGAGGLIPGGATLIFETELLDIVRPPSALRVPPVFRWRTADLTVCARPVQKNRKPGKDEL